jgi:hypothetical protein
MSLRVPRRVAATIAASALISGGVLVGAPTARADSDGPGYRGSAVALRVAVGLGGTTILDSVLPGGLKFPTGGSDDLIALPPEVSKVVTLKVLHEFSGLTEQGTLASGAAAAGLSLLGDLLGATLLTADCTAVGQRVGGASLVAGLSLAGTKIPVDPGPDVRIEIPEALRTLIEGGIYLNEQSHTPDGALQIRALHVHLVIAPAALATALRSTIEHVRAVALQVTQAVERMTGKTLDQLLAPTRVSPSGRRGALAERGARTGGAAAGVAKPPAPVHPIDVRAAPVARNGVVDRAAAEPGSADAAPAAGAAPAAPVTPAVAAAPVAPAAPEAPAQQAGAAGTRKADGASIPRQPASAAEPVEGATATARAERGEKGAPPPAAPQATIASTATPAPKDIAAPQQAAPGSPATGQVPAQAPPAVEAFPAPQPVQNSGSPGASYGNPPAATAGPPRAALARESARAGTHVRSKVDGAELSVADRAAAPTATVAAGGLNGLLGVDVVVSQVTCKGGEVLQAVTNQHTPVELPRTGGDRHLAKDLGVTGLGLFALGSAVVVIVRRRGLRHD